MAMGSPFGALAPSHFANHTAAGTISNALQLPVRPASIQWSYAQPQHAQSWTYLPEMASSADIAA